MDNQVFWTAAARPFVAFVLVYCILTPARKAVERMKDSWLKRLLLRRVSK